MLVGKNSRIRELKIELKKKLKLDNGDKKILRLVKSNPVFLESLANVTKNKHGRRYNHMRIFATKLQLASAKSYKALRRTEVLCVPHPRTVLRWQRDVSSNPGFNHEILQRMESMGKSMSTAEKVVCVLIDGMAIKSSLHYHAGCDTFFGLPDDGTYRRNEHNDPAHLATEAITVMARSVNGKFKQVSTNKQH